MVLPSHHHGAVLTDAEIAHLVAVAATNTISEYQLAAWLMAVVWRDLNPAELHSLTTHMRDSARVLRFSSVPGVKVDKHSTGVSVLAGTRSSLETAGKGVRPKRY